MLFKDLGRFFLRPFQKDRGLRAFVHRALYPGAKWSAGIIVVGGLLLALVFGWELTETALGYAAYLLSAYALVLLVLSLVPLARLLRERALRLPPVRMYLQQEVLRARIALYGGVQGAADAAVEAFLAGSLHFDPNAACNHHHEGGEHHCHGEGAHTCGHHGGEHHCRHGQC